MVQRKDATRMRRLWKRNKNTKFVMRWDKGTDEVHIQYYYGEPHLGLGSKTYEVIGSGATGGFFHIGYSKTIKHAIVIAKRWMKIFII